MKKLLKMKRKLVKLVVNGIDGIHLYSGISKETENSIRIRQVVAGNITGEVFYFRKNLRRVKRIDDTLNYYIGEDNASVRKYSSSSSK